MVEFKKQSLAGGGKKWRKKTIEALKKREERTRTLQPSIAFSMVKKKKRVVFVSIRKKYETLKLLGVGRERNKQQKANKQ